MGKKKKSEMATQRQLFIDGARERDIPEETANEVFELMAKFAGYGFNKSHAAAYSIVAYQTAYLKANYPAEFLAAAMTNEMGDTKKLSVVLEDARHLGIDLLPPSVNDSQAHFTVSDGKIRFGLGAIKGVGMGAIESILSARDKQGPFTSLFSLVRLIDTRSVNKKAIECLAKAGALDELEGHRAQLTLAVDAAIQYAHKFQADLAAGQNSLFGSTGDGAATLEPSLPTVDPWPRGRILKEERESVGFYVSGHPLEPFLPEIRTFASAQVADAEQLAGANEGGDTGYRANRPQHSFCGIITEVTHRTNKSGRPYAFVQFEDFSGQAEMVCFSNTYDRIQQYLKTDEIVLIRGSVDMRGGSVKVLANDVIPMWKVRSQFVKALIVRIDADQLSDDHVDRLEKVLTSSPGACRLYFDLISRATPRPVRLLSRSCVIDPTNEVMLELTKMFGKHAVVVEGES
jgi:DNA polymerase-3 subunit alpha